MAAHRLRPAPPTLEAAVGQGIPALGTWKNLRADTGISKFGIPAR